MWQAVTEQEVDGTTTIGEHPLEADGIDAWVEDQGEAPWLRNSSPPILTTERDLAMRPREEPWVGDSFVVARDIETFAFEQLVLAFAFCCYLFAEDRLNLCYRSDVFMVGILVVVFIFIFTPSAGVSRLLSVGVLGFLAREGVLEGTALLHSMIGLGMYRALSLEEIYIIVAEPPKSYGPHAPVIIPKTSDGMHVYLIT